MIRTRCALVASVAILLAVGIASAETFTWNGTLSNGQTLTVMDINGSIDVKPSAGNAVNVVAEKTSRRGSTADVEIKVEQEAQGVVVCTLYRRDDGSFPAGCRDRSKGRSKKNVDVRVEYTIRMPAQANLDANTVNGNVAIAGMMVWSGRFLGARTFGCPASSVNSAPRFWSMKPLPSGTTPEPKPE